MIEITRALARQFRAVLRKAAPPGSGRSNRPCVMVSTDQTGLYVRAQHPEVGVAYHLPGKRIPDDIVLPPEVLEDIEGGKESIVTLENVGADTVQARWDDGGVPQIKDYPAPKTEKLPPFPEEPSKLTRMESGLLKAMDDATHSAARDQGPGFTYSIT